MRWRPAALPVGRLSPAAPRVRGVGCRGERRWPKIDEVGAVAGDAARRRGCHLGRGRQAGMEGRSDRGMKMKQGSCTPLIVRRVA
jgi:hypothetical protein